MLKGWVDRVFSRGFAYSAGRKYESGHFKGKRAMLCLTTGTASTLYEANAGQSFEAAAQDEARLRTA